MAKNGLIQKVKIKKEFSYQNDDVALDFTLNVDNPHELLCFLSCLKAAIKDVEKSLEDIQK